jgi:hypothetical protein
MCLTLKAIKRVGLTVNDDHMITASAKDNVAFAG